MCPVDLPTHPKKLGDVTPFIFKGDWARLGPFGPPNRRFPVRFLFWGDRAEKPHTDTLFFAMGSKPFYLLV